MISVSMAARDFLHLVANDRSAQFESLPLYPFAMWLVRKPLQGLVAGPVVAPIDKGRHENHSSRLREERRELHLFGQLISVRDRNDKRLRFAARPKQESFSIYSIEDRPADMMNRIRFFCCWAAGARSTISSIRPLLVGRLLRAWFATSLGVLRQKKSQRPSAAASCQRRSSIGLCALRFGFQPPTLCLAP
jgi:hypothetical protein